MTAAEAFTPRRLGRYTLLRPLGTGGMAELVLARADGIEGFSKLVALKRIHPHRVQNHRFIRMFLDEARLVARLDHPNIAAVYDIGQEDGEYFFTMEYVHGPDLARILAQAPERRLQLENVLHVAIGLCAGLHRAHEARDESGRVLEIVHRDVSPSNVLVSYQGAVKLVDFGVAKAATIVSETDDGVIKGKYGYMSPEQCLGEQLTRQSDVFNVGILLWEMTVGRRLYKVNGDLVTLQRIVYADAPPPSRYVREYPRALERIVMRALARDRAHRYATAEQLQLELEAFALEHRIPVSAVSMGLEMRTLFRDRVEAWQQAQEAGRSLADHLVEISSDHAPERQSGSGAGIDDVLADLELGDAEQAPTAAPAPAVLRATRRAPRVEEARDEASGRGRLAAIAVVLVTAGAIGGTLAMRPWESSEPAMREQVPDPSPAIVVEKPAEPPTHEELVVAVDATEPAEPAEPAPATKLAVKPVPKRPARAHAVRTNPTPAIAEPPPPVLPPVEPAPPEAQVPANPELDRLPDGQRPGTVDPAAVRVVVRSHLGEVVACIDRARMDNRDLHGRVVIRIDVAPSGHATRVSVASSAGAPATLQSCITRTATAWSFPPPAGGVAGAFSYPFAF